jgi:acetoacetyl-CoA synthetase
MTQPQRLLWSPSAAQQHHATMQTFLDWLAARGRTFSSYDELYRWSVDDLAGFWAALWEYFAIAGGRYQSVLDSHSMPGVRWFSGAQINYSAQVFAGRDAAATALIVADEQHAPRDVSWGELRQLTGSLMQTLRAAGVRSGDRVVGYLPNGLPAIVGLLATAGLGAIWSACSPDFGSPSVIDRFSQIAPTVLIAVDGYRYGGKTFDRRAEVAAVRAALPSLKLTISVATLFPAAPAAAGAEPVLAWDEAIAMPGPLDFTPVEFNHPLWVLYSSGTTGLPKPIVHSQGGIMLEHMKSLHLHFDMRAGERFFWYTTTGWMMWNFLVGALLIGAVPICYDGSPVYPDHGALWRLAEQTRMKFFGTSAGFITALMKTDAMPGRDYDLSALQGIGSTGSPLPPEGFDWIYSHIHPQIWLVSYSGGTDVCSGFVGGCVLLPVYQGEIQCRILGVRAEAFDATGRSVIDEMGELVITAPMPSMPIGFWNDPGDARYLASYFEQYPGVWRHGDWALINQRGGVVIYGRSDSTINRQGIRMGTSEIYRAVEQINEVLDSLVIDLEGLGGASYMPLFVVLRDGCVLDDALRTRIKQAVRSALSPRHVPDDVFAINEVPMTLSGKKLEVPIRRILLGTAVEQAANPDSLRNPAALQPFLSLRETIGARLGRQG